MRKKFVIIAMAILALSLSALPVLAQSPVQPFGSNQLQDSMNANLGLGNRDPREIAASVINVIMGFLGVIAVIGIIAGGFIMMTSGGSEEKNGTGKKAITAGVIGLIIILAAWGITIFVFNALLSATGANTSV